MEIMFLVVVKHIRYYSFTSFLIILGFSLLSYGFTLSGETFKNVSGETFKNVSGETFQSSIIPTCVSRYIDSNNYYANDLCYPIARPYEMQGENYYINSSLLNNTLIPSVVFEK